MQASAAGRRISSPTAPLFGTRFGEHYRRHLDIRLAAAGLRLRADGATIRIEGSPGLIQLDARQVLDRSPGDGQIDPDLGQAVWVATFGQDLRDAPEEGLVEAFRRNLVEARGGRAHGSEPVKFSLVLTNRGH